MTFIAGAINMRIVSTMDEDGSGGEQGKNPKKIRARGTARTHARGSRSTTPTPPLKLVNKQKSVLRWRQVSLQRPDAPRLNKTVL